MALVVAAQTATQLTVTGFAETPGTVNLTVTNGPVASQPFSVQVGVSNPQVSPSAARRFLEQAAFGATPADAAHVQTIGFQAWLAEQFNLPVISNFNGVPASQSGMPQWFLANAVTNADQLRQRVSFALSQIFVVSITKIIWNGDMVPYEQMLLADAFTNYRQILGDVTLSAGMGEYLDMANNAKANPAAGTAANENYAREIMQLMSIGTNVLNPDGSKQTGPSGPIPLMAGRMSPSWHACLQAGLMRRKSRAVRPRGARTSIRAVPWCHTPRSTIPAPEEPVERLRRSLPVFRRRPI